MPRNLARRAILLPVVRRYIYIAFAVTWRPFFAFLRFFGLSIPLCARLGWRASRRAVRRITVRRSIAAPLASLAHVHS